MDPSDGMGFPDCNKSGSNLGDGSGVNHQYSKSFPFPTKTGLSPSFGFNPPEKRTSEPVDTTVCPTLFTVILELIVTLLKLWFTY
jgi:hypothetical protein